MRQPDVVLVHGDGARNLLQVHGWAVLTFWGRTILRNPRACAQQIAEVHRRGLQNRNPDSKGKTMPEFHKIWTEQCKAACGIKEAWGTHKTLGYLIGEKLMNFMRVSDQRPEFAAELPHFVEEIKRIFEPSEILSVA